MVTEKLTYQDICRQAEDAYYRLQYDRKEWPPASHVTDTRAPSATFGNVALPEGSPITRAEVLNLIQSQTPRQDAPKKGNCHNCGKPGHWSNKCPKKGKIGRKNVPRTGTQVGATGANKTQSWRTVSPPPGTAMSKKVKDKTFNWCKKCRRWTTTHTTATHTGQCQNTANSTPAAQASLSAFSVADPSVWLLDLDDPPKKTQPTMLESICELLFSKTTVLLVYSVILCLALPMFINFATQVSQFILWAKHSTWIVDSLHQVIREHPTLLLAPVLWLTFFAATFWKPKERQQETNANASISNTRRRRRRFAKLLKSSLKPQRAVQHRKALTPLPYRLRKRRHQNIPNSPTLEMQASLRDLDKLKTRTLLFQGQVRRLRTRRSPYATNAFNTKGGIGTSNRFQQTQQRKKPRCPKYYPVPADGASDAFASAPWTTQQRNAANKIISHVNLACTATLRMALQAPARMRNALGAATKSAPIIWDSGASISISPDPEDFQDTMRNPGTITQLKGIARGLQIKGQGEVTWAVHDTNGNLRMIKVPAFYVPGIKVRLLSTTSLLQTYQNETTHLERSSW